jgi:hypothetical protein
MEQPDATWFVFLYRGKCYEIKMTTRYLENGKVWKLCATKSASNVFLPQLKDEERADVIVTLKEALVEFGLLYRRLDDVEIQFDF